MNTGPPTTQRKWSADRIDDHFRSFRAPLRLAVLDDFGYPLICSLWFEYESRKIFCATKKNSKVVKCLARDPKCGFELAANEAPYFGIRGRGIATISAAGADELLARLIDRYLGTRDSRFATWLLSHAEDEVAIEIEVEWMTSWDYSARMSA